jgi:hypothetical protein
MTNQKIIMYILWNININFFEYFKMYKAEEETFLGKKIKIIWNDGRGEHFLINLWNFVKKTFRYIQYIYFPKLILIIGYKVFEIDTIPSVIWI